MVRGDVLMRKRSTIRFAAGWLACALLSAGTALADSELGLRRMAGDGFEISGLRIVLRDAADAAAPRLRLDIERARVAGTEFRSLVWECSLGREGDALRCAGPLRWRGGPRGTLRLVREDGWQLRWRDGERRVDARLDAALQAVSLSWRQLPLSALEAWVATALPEGVSITGGQLTGKADGDVGLSAWKMESGFDALALDSEDGLTAAADVAGSLQLRWRGGDSPSVDVNAEFSAGEWLSGQWYIRVLPGSSLALGARQGAAGWVLDGPLRFSDPRGADVRLALPATAGNSDTWRVEAALPNLADAGPRYLDGPLAALGFGGAGFAGALRAELEGGPEGVQRIALQADGLTFADPKGVIVLSGADGDWRWQREGESETSSLRWQALSIQGIALGPAELRGRSRNGLFEAEAPLDFAPFGGSLRLHPLRFQPLQASAEFDAEMADIRLAALSAQLGWPEFEGVVSGSLPAASYRDEVLASDGTLRIGVFDGTVTVGSLRWERPFGIAPSLSAEVEFDGLDLKPLTGAFGFGEITGRLDGHVRGLRMLDGSPVAFDAMLRTDDEWKGRRRISQRAVNNIGSVGGGAATAGLQATVLKLFDTFGYRRIGISCRLSNNVCEMGGVEDLDQGYVLIEGAGIPRVMVNGYRRRVDWPVLLARLEAAASGGGISVD
ncbi:YdbH domain-containing protein [Pseudomarimonas salicorniae]|uniref:YdbH domain-containing protein n=1 Tax=Pseudomarimonas salicorniae TaxID=2933270 RepID=A0ABT0GJR7_9GAMM|nr:YdbH domain-containing protein [Lysobacter sp. CAU 1642]MCK7594800.1 YdbH domain-containing protein [Lysobacter sp. CAU 1642]